MTFLKPVITEKYYSIQECQAHTRWLYVFGDNLERIGQGGQAIIRKQLNSIGIATLISIGQPFRDEEYEDNCSILDQEIEAVRKAFSKPIYSTLVFPSAGIGWGRAGMQRYCPRTALYLCQRLLEEFRFNNLADLVNSKQF